MLQRTPIAQNHRRAGGDWNMWIIWSPLGYCTDFHGGHGAKKRCPSLWPKCHGISFNMAIEIMGFPNQNGDFQFAM